MRKWFWIGVASIVLVALAVGGGIAQASRNTGVPAASATEHQWGGYLDSATLTRVATALGLTPAELTAQLQAGKTLAQVSKDKGVATEKVVEAILAPHKDQLQLRVKYGYLTQAQSDSLLATAKQQAELTLNQTFTAPGITGTPSTPGYSADDMESYCNSVMGSGGMGGMMGGTGMNGMMGGYSGGMMGGYGGGMMGGGMMGGYGAPSSGSGFGSWGQRLMGGWW